MKYGVVFRMFLQDALAYRLEGFVWFLLDILPPVVMIALWLAAFKDRSVIGGYTLGSMLLYYFAMGAFSTLLTGHPEWGASYEIRMGEYSRLLLKPISPNLYYFIGQIAWKIVRLLFLSPIVIVGVALLFGKLEWPALQPHHLLGLAAAIPLSYVMQFCFKLGLGYLAFWVSEPSGFYGLFGTTLAFLGGAILPLDLMPAGLLRASAWLPFHYFLFFPVQLLLGRVSAGEVVLGLAASAVWCAVSIGFMTLIFRLGIRDYAAVGG